MTRLQKLILSRLALGVVTLFAVSALMFVGIELLPGDLAQQILGQSATAETLAAFRAELGLDQPPHLRYLDWLSGVVQGDFGQSLASRRDVAELLSTRLANTMFLAAYAAVIAVPIAVVLGLLAALWRNTLFDRSANIGALSAISMPEFFVAYLLILVFSIKLGWFPTLARIDSVDTLGGALHATFLPALTLILVVIAHMMRMTRAAIINVLAAPYIEMARLKGVPRWRVVLRHALPNALAPIINVIALNLAYLIVGVVVVEVVFSYPGLGQLLVDAVASRDFPVVQAVGLFFAGTYILLNVAADILSILSNPRLRHGR
ncbi:ABC transporter permease [Limimaricola pyoseonensis]|uniref:Peptide/nickel transport system permease protein n=1 Tax=Limimaricola pyoseonensis TaxID=521013 RepID=A0A1G7KTB7_9RHOB|nr:ABC transporter permease [Limimaricola pyoseonensis]SDF40180.1 peptide/nickel transport system permease protein [Limimaricola pyoseonensis]